MTDLGSRGQGVGRTESGLVVMVADSVPGDQVQVRVSGLQSRHVEAVLEEVLQPSPRRTEARCRHFGDCGGCSLQMMTPDAQRLFKASRLRELLRRQEGLGDVAVDEAVAVGAPYGYRGRVSMGARVTAKGVSVGLHRRQGGLLDLQECHLPHRRIMDLVSRLRAALVAWRRQHPESQDLSMRVDIRHSRAEDRLLLTLFCRNGPPAGLKRALMALADANPGLEVALGGPRRAQPVTAGKRIHEVLAGVPVPLDADIFIQTHPEGAAALYQEALAWLWPVAPGPFLDLYAGVGVLARAACPRFGPAVAVESSQAAVRMGRRARTPEIDCTFMGGEARHVVARLAEEGRSFVAASVNPPRAGMHRSLPAGLAALGVQRIAYISCHPATLARDLKRLAGAGFIPRKVTPYDLFPQTGEMEVLARLEAVAESAAR